VGIEPDPKAPVFEDDHIALTLNAFNRNTRVGTVCVREKNKSVGRYRVVVRFSSGHEAILNFDGRDKDRSAFLVVRAPEEHGDIAQIEVRRVSD
jgi:hypothetical protein